MPRPKEPFVVQKRSELTSFVTAAFFGALAVPHFSSMPLNATHYLGISDTSFLKILY